MVINFKKKSLKVNVLLNVIKTLLSIIFPLITFPYASRILQVSNLGKVTYTASIVSYFSLIAGLGISTYSIREGARLRCNKRKFENFLNEIFSINIITTIIAYTLLIILLLISTELRNYSSLILIQSLVIVFSTLGIDWINSIYEDYLYITIRSIIIQIVSVLLLFIFIRKPEDYYKYVWLNVASTAIICVCNFIYCKKYCHIKFIFNMKFFYHIKYMMIFFANSLSINIYCNSDKTMIGAFHSDYYIGIYEVAVKIYNVIKNMIAAIFVACLPRFSYHLGNGRIQDYKKLLNQIIEALTLILFPSVIGLILLSKEVITILAGSEYYEAIPTVKILSIGIIFAIYGGIITNCINIPFRKEKINLYATMMAAIINFVLNLFLIPIYKHNGAAISTVIAEFSVVIYCIIKNKDILMYLDKNIIVTALLHSSIGAFLIFVCSILLNMVGFNGFIYIFLLILLGGSLYLGVLILLKNNFIIQVIIRFRNKL